MQFPWLEELVKKGHVTEADRNSIYADCSAVVKTAASDAQKAAEIHALAVKMQGGMMSAMKVPLFVGALALPIVLNKVLGKMGENAEIKTTLAAISKNRADLLAKPEFAQHAQKAGARFDEIAGLAPTVARNPALVGRLLEEKLHTGLTAEDVNSLAIIQASYTPKYSYQEKLTKHAAEEKLGETAADMLLICAEAGLIKQAAGGKMGIFGVPSGLSKVLSHSLMMTAGPILFGLGRGAVDHLSEIRNKTVREKRLTESFQAALDSPEGESLRDQPEKARQAFQTLAHFSPNVAMQPVAARSFMKKLIDYKGDVHSGDIRDLTDIEAKMRSAGPSPFLKGFREGADAAGFKDAFKGSLAPITGPYSRQLETELATSLGVSSKSRPVEASAG
jgi:hypothetical protein